MALRGTARAVPRSRLPSGSSGAGAQGGGEAGRRADSRVTLPEGGPPDEPVQVLARGDLVPEGRIIVLEAEGELTVHSTVSTREITLVGPAAAETCPGGEEAVRLARGKVTAFPGSGVRPGAEVWIATPLGVVRFNDAKLAIDVPDDAAARLEVAVITGQAMFVPVAGIVAPALTAGRAAPGGDPKGTTASGLTGGEPIALAPGTTFTARRPEGAISRWGADLVAACVRDATAAHEAGERVVAPGDAGREMLADLASAHVKARQRARSACEAAWAVGPLAPGLLDAARLSDLERADATWKGAPGRSGAYQLTPLPARR